MRLSKLFSMFRSPEPAPTPPGPTRHAGDDGRSALRADGAGTATARAAAAPHAPAKQPPAAARRPDGPAKGGRAKSPGKPVAPPPVRVAAPPPPVPPVGARGETDLTAHGHAPENMPFRAVHGSADDVDRASLRELFSEIAASQVSPVKNFIAELRARNASKEWLEICRPVMAVLVESASSLGLSDEARCMTDFGSALDLASDGKEGTIDDGAREIILEAFEAMARVLPEAFTQGAAEQRRETMLLHALLKQVSGVGLVTLDRLYASALTSLEALLKANPSELSTTTGISMSLCEGICEKLREHRMEIDRTAHLPLEQRFGARLRELLTELAREHEDFERLSDDGGFDDGRAERKRACRRSRNLCALKIEATLVEMGEIDRADRLRVLSFEQRIVSLQEFLGVRVAKRATEQR